mgnify:FL=1
MTWSKTFEQMGVQLCNECGEDTSFTSFNGKFVNRVPADDGWLCPDCLNDIENEFEKENDKMISDAITTVGFALQSHVNTCYHEDTEENKAEREELKVAWSVIKSHLNMSDDTSKDKLQPQRGH